MLEHLVAIAILSFSGAAGGAAFAYVLIKKGSTKLNEVTAMFERDLEAMQQDISAYQALTEAVQELNRRLDEAA
jgi:type II secretory pathway pseudopilin PulG